jgi:hypothetical protein
VAGARKWKAQNVVVAINQPRLPADKRLTIAEYTEADLPAAQTQLVEIFDGAHNADGTPKADVPRVAGEDQCRYCSARMHCDAYRAKFEFLSKPSQNGKDFFVQKLVELTDADLDRVHVAIRFAALISDSVKEEILRRMENHGMQNYEQKATGNTSTLTDPVKAVELLEGIGFTKTEVIKRAKFSLDALSEDWREKNGGTHVAAKRAVRDALTPVLEITPKAPSLKRLHDPIAGIDDQPKLL